MSNIMVQSGTVQQQYSAEEHKTQQYIMKMIDRNDGEDWFKTRGTTSRSLNVLE